jgi:metal-responsive CopG/Arc/MetJ family transcriptional regulator
MKLSISLSESEVAALDEYQRQSGLSSRSAVVQRAIRLLRHEHLEEDYAAAWQEWDSSEDSIAWDTASGDGL